MAARLMGYVSASNTPTVVQQSVYGRATGGIGAPTAVTINSVDYEYLTFNATGTLTVTTAGWFDYLAVGGGGGALSASFSAGGGGGGCLEIGSIYLDSNQTITIGAGGAFALGATLHTAGDTIIAATSPFGRTIGGNFSKSNGSSGANELAVGGGNGSYAGGTATVFTTAYGKNGGNSTATTNGGGGGSVNNVGGNGSSTTGGAGAEGFDVSVFIGGGALFKAMGGGGGGSGTGGAAPTDGVAGAATTTPPNGNANSGGGGGGGSNTLTTGNGGNGICYIRWSVA
jgi:fibronectin-binding autotransporter adhesin